MWLSSESDPRAVSARSVAADLDRDARAAHLVWNPCSGEIVQLLPATRAARLLGDGAGREGRVCVQIMVVGHARDPFTNSLLRGVDTIVRWLDSWGVARRWPAGPPLPSPQSYHSGRSRKDWARGGHFGGSQIPQTGRPDPGGIDIRRVTGPDTPVATIPRPRAVPGEEVGSGGVTSTAAPFADLRPTGRRPRNADHAHGADPTDPACAVRAVSGPTRAPAEPVRAVVKPLRAPSGSVPADAADPVCAASADPARAAPEPARGATEAIRGEPDRSSVVTPAVAPAVPPAVTPAVPPAPEPASIRS